MEKDVNLMWAALVVVLFGVTHASNQVWEYCYGDLCNPEQEVFCCDLLEMCRPCTEILDDCFTPDMPRNCTQTCLDDYVRRELKLEQDKPCEGLKKILHGNHNGTHSDQQTQGTSIQFACQNGYRLIGQDLLQCKQYGQWSSPPPKCKEVTCAVLSSIKHGKHNGSAWKLGFGTVVNTVCNDGTKLYGQNVTTCSHGGQWTNNLPICEPMMCAEPPAIRNGKWEPSRESLKQFAHGDILLVKCDSGYYTQSSDPWTCQECLWQSNDSFVPVCFKKGDSSKSYRSTIIAILSVVLLVSIVGNFYQCRAKKKDSSSSTQNYAKFGKRLSNESNESSTSHEEIQNVSDNKNKLKDSPVVVSLHRNNTPKPVNDVVTDNLPPPNTIDSLSKEDTALVKKITSEPGNVFNIIVKNKNVIENSGNNTNHAKTCDRNEEDENTRNTRSGTNETSKPSHFNDKHPVEESGNALQPEYPNAPDATTPKQSEDLPNDTIRMEPELPTDNVPTVPDSHDVNGSLNVEPLGGTAPMKSISEDRSASSMLPQTGTQPLKPADGYATFQETPTESTSPRQSLDEDFDDNEYDGESETSSLLPNTSSYVPTTDDFENLLRTEDNVL